eukprot:1159940-Pelagomonas_calceolata.AAC.12
MHRSQNVRGHGPEAYIFLSALTNFGTALKQADAQKSDDAQEKNGVEGCVCFELNPQKANVALLTYSPKEGPQVFDEISRNGS